MIIKMEWENGYVRMVECDTLEITRGEKRLSLGMLERDKVIESPVFEKEAVDIFVMENGKTIDRIHFQPEK